MTNNALENSGLDQVSNQIHEHLDLLSTIRETVHSEILQPANHAGYQQIEMAAARLSSILSLAHRDLSATLSSLDRADRSSHGVGDELVGRALFATPAPDLQSVIYKIEYARKQWDEFQTWPDDWSDAVLADLHCLASANEVSCEPQTEKSETATALTR